MATACFRPRLTFDLDQAHCLTQKSCIIPLPEGQSIDTYDTGQVNL